MIKHLKALHRHHRGYVTDIPLPETLSHQIATSNLVPAEDPTKQIPEVSVRLGSTPTGVPVLRTVPVEAEVDRIPRKALEIQQIGPVRLLKTLTALQVNDSEDLAAEIDVDDTEQNVEFSDEDTERAVETLLSPAFPASSVSPDSQFVDKAATENVPEDSSLAAAISVEKSCVKSRLENALVIDGKIHPHPLKSNPTDVPFVQQPSPQYPAPDDSVPSPTSSLTESISEQQASGIIPPIQFPPRTDSLPSWRSQQSASPSPRFIQFSQTILPSQSPQQSQGLFFYDSPPKSSRPRLPVALKKGRSSSPPVPENRKAFVMQQADAVTFSIHSHDDRANMEPSGASPPLNRFQRILNLHRAGALRLPSNGTRPAQAYRSAFSSLMMSMPPRPAEAESLDASLTPVSEK